MIQRRGLCFATSPLLTAFGRTPATHVAPPRGWLLRCSYPRLGSLFAAQEHRRYEREPHTPRKRLITNPLRGLRRPAAGVRPSAQREKGGRCTTRTSSINQREKGERCTTQTPSYAPAIRGALHNTNLFHESTREDERSQNPHDRKHCVEFPFCFFDRLSIFTKLTSGYSAWENKE